MEEALAKQKKGTRNRRGLHPSLSFKVFKCKINEEDLFDTAICTPASADEDTSASLSTPSPQRKRFRWSASNMCDLEAAILAYDAIPIRKDTPLKVDFIVTHMNTPGIDKITVAGRLETRSRLKRASVSLQAS